MTSIKKIFGNTLAFGVLPKIPAIVDLFLLPVITPYLTLDDYGIWGVVSAYSWLFVALAPLGLNVHLTNSYFEVRNWKIYWGHIFFLFLVSGVICSAIYIAFIISHLDYVPFATRITIAVCSSAPILLFGTTTVSSHLYPLLSKPLPLVIRNLVASLCAISVTFVTIYYLRLGFWGWIFGSLTSAVVSFCLFGYVLYKKERIYPHIEHNKRRITYWLKIAGPVIPHSLGFTLLASSSRIVMSFYEVPLEDIGVYSNGYSMGNYVAVLIAALATALAPEVQRAYREGRFDDFRHIFYFCQFTAMLLVFLVSCWMPDIYRLMMRNPDLMQAAPIASLMCYANVLLPLYNTLSIAVFISKDTKNLLWLVFLPGILNVVLCFICIPLFGYKAAVVSTLIGFWSMLIVPFVSRFHRLKVKEWIGHRGKLPTLLAIVIISMTMSNTIKDYSIGAKIIITFILSGGYLYTIKHFKSLRTF